jgi:hypothetical protein
MGNFRLAPRAADLGSSWRWSGNSGRGIKAIASRNTRPSSSPSTIRAASAWWASRPEDQPRHATRSRSVRVGASNGAEVCFENTQLGPQVIAALRGGRRYTADN